MEAWRLWIFFVVEAAVLISLADAQCREVSTAQTMRSQRADVYNNLLDKCWVLRAATGQRAFFTFTFIETEREFDFVYVYDGEGDSKVLLAKNHGQNSDVHDREYMSTGNTLTVVLTTDGTKQKRGFTADVRFGDALCGFGKYGDSSGYPPCTDCPVNTYNDNFGVSECTQCPNGKVTQGITGARDEHDCLVPCIQIRSEGALSSQDAATYRSNEDKCWTIVAPTGYAVRFVFSDLSTEEEYDFVRIFYGNTINSYLLAELDGDQVPEKVFSSPEEGLTIQLTSDESNNDAGFSGTISFADHRCPPGHYSTDGDSPCEYCPQNRYSVGLSNTRCDQCPAGTTTEGRLAATGPDECIDTRCAPGTFSDTGRKPCKPCAADTYADSLMSTQCTPCPVGTTTGGAEGASDVEQCAEPDPTIPCSAGRFSTTGNQPCQPCPIGSYEPDTGSRQCTSCSEGQTTAGAGATRASECYPAGTSILDPHFMITHPLTRERLCFDYTGEDGQQVILVEDANTGTLVTGRLFDAAANPSSPLIYFSQIIISTRYSRMVLSKQDIDISGVGLDWHITEPYQYKDLVVLPVADDDTVRVECGNGDVSFVVTRNYGNHTGYYLGVYLANVHGLSQETSGLLGQFINVDFSIVEENSVSQAYVTFHDRVSKVPVTSQPRYSPTTRDLQACWFYKPMKEQEDALLGDSSRYVL